jgi:hypothetical protein
MCRVPHSSPLLGEVVDLFGTTAVANARAFLFLADMGGAGLQACGTGL